jgi:hypothetical protein
VASTLASAIREADRQSWLAGPAAAEVASYLAHIVEACVEGHRDIDRLLDDTRFLLTEAHLRSGRHIESSQIAEFARRIIKQYAMQTKR